jgi:hypothetical protein
MFPFFCREVRMAVGGKGMYQEFGVKEFGSSRDFGVH